MSDLVKRAIKRWQPAFRCKPRAFGVVVGCPRSGTTALCDWLSKSQRVTVVQETRVLVAAFRFFEEVNRFKKLVEAKRTLGDDVAQGVFNYYSRLVFLPGRLLIEKETLEPIGLLGGNYKEFISFLLDWMPKLRLLFMVRHPVPTIWSLVNRQWGFSLRSEAIRSFTLSEGIAIWREATRAVLHHHSPGKTYLCRFETLTSDPKTESRQISDYLGLRHPSPFTPRDTKHVRFTARELSQVMTETAPEREKLNYLSPNWLEPSASFDQAASYPNETSTTSLLEN